jgi:hypothetical protein
VFFKSVILFILPATIAKGGQIKKINFARGNLKKKLQGVTQNSPILQGGKDLLTIFLIKITALLRTKS